MKNSAIEKEIFSYISRAKYRVNRHDKGVVIAFIFSAIPMFPISFFGLTISLFNYFLIKSGKLKNNEKSAVKLTIIIGLINSILSFIMIIFVMRLFFSFDFNNAFGEIFTYYKSIFSFVRNLFFKSNDPSEWV